MKIIANISDADGLRAIDFRIVQTEEDVDPAVQLQNLKNMVAALKGTTSTSSS
jgi:hypothetical protein